MQIDELRGELATLADEMAPFDRRRAIAPPPPTAAAHRHLVDRGRCSVVAIGVVDGRAHSQ